jgi:uncharacterized DUF497 family protein
MRFEWDERKNRVNLRKHAVSFEEAARAFEDPLAVSRIDPRHDDERWLTLGLVDNRILLVAHTYHGSESDDQEESIRIISARQATAVERRAYESEAGLRH